ncbi:hypothetical protein [Pedobacter sp.]|jgi:hypothetical protein|uniref:hypothetical protein n=1 Tax=Pedobacter sp. TaxID=1411316 RepID=UPI002C51CA4B|nr:hypothetical protein [Pedobacter sp.]HWW41889.1 hypothetical protein [Pedobacter sp.]
MKKLLIIIPLIFLAAGCNTQPSSSGNTNPTATTLPVSQTPVQTPPNSTQQSPAPVTTQNENFQKKMQCATYKQQVQDNLNKIMSSLEIPSLYQIFYSPSRDSCLSAEEDIYPAHDTIAESEILSINDILTGKVIWFQRYQPALKYWDANAKLDAEITALSE